MGSLRGIKKATNGIAAKRVKTAQEAFQEGFKAGTLIGAKQTSELFCDALETLQGIEGIGPKRYKAILKHFGYDDVSELSKENRWGPHSSVTNGRGSTSVQK